MVEHIGLNFLTIPHIIERLLDNDEHVRSAAILKCSQISPNYIKITKRQRIIQCGFVETNPLSKRIFIEHLIPRWLAVYDDDIIEFFRKLYMDGNEEDLNVTFTMYNNLMMVFCKSKSFDELLSNLPLDHEKCIPFEELSFEVVSFWNILTDRVRNFENGDEYLERIVPDLLDMCTYIQR